MGQHRILAPIPTRRCDAGARPSKPGAQDNIRAGCDPDAMELAGHDASACGAHAASGSSTGMLVEEGSPQDSHSQWCRISPPSTNSEDTGATIQSPHWGQRAGAAKARIAESFAELH